MSLQMGDRSGALPVTQGSMACRTSAPVLPTICPTKCSCSCSVKCSAKSGHTCTSHPPLKPAAIPWRSCRLRDFIHRLLPQAPDTPLSQQPFTGEGWAVHLLLLRADVLLHGRARGGCQPLQRGRVLAGLPRALAAPDSVHRLQGRAGLQALTVTHNQMAPSMSSMGIQAVCYPLTRLSSWSLIQGNTWLPLLG